MTPSRNQRSVRTQKKPQAKITIASNDTLPDGWANVRSSVGGAFDYHGGIAYVGENEARRRAPALALPTLRASVAYALRRANTVWRWPTATLVIGFADWPKMRGRDIAGEAINSGHGARDGVRIVLLNLRVIARGGASELRRVVLHELAHHHREERWPRKCTNYEAAHDARFDETLAAVTLGGRLGEAIRARVATPAKAKPAKAKPAKAKPAKAKPAKAKPRPTGKAVSASGRTRPRSRGRTSRRRRT